MRIQLLSIEIPSRQISSRLLIVAPYVDYNPFPVQPALALLGGAGREVMLECGSVVKVVKEPSVHCGGELFRDDIETSLPYVETATR